jgi:hypothetical protein
MLAIGEHNGIRIAEVGFALGAVAGVLFALGGVLRRNDRLMIILGGIALAAGSVLLIIAVHWGKFGW